MQKPKPEGGRYNAAAVRAVNCKKYLTEGHVVIAKAILSILSVGYSKCSDGWYSLPCLFGKHNHSNGADIHPSAKMSPDGNGYRCFACSASYRTAEIMLWDLFKMNTNAGVSNERVNAALAYCSGNKAPPHLASESGGSVSNKEQGILPFPKEYLARFPSVLLKSPSTGTYAFRDAIDFLANRRTPLQVIQDFDLRWDAAYKRIVFPTFLKGKVCAGLEGRFINFNADIVGMDTATKYWVYTHSPKKGDAPRSNSGIVWFRQSKLRLSKPVVLAEGVFDAARIYQHYRNVTAISGAFISPAKLAYLKQFKQVILLPDNDATGERSALTLKELYPAVQIVRVPTRYKDAGEMPSAEMRSLLEEHLRLDAPLLTKKESEEVRPP